MSIKRKRAIGRTAVILRVWLAAAIFLLVNVPVNADGTWNVPGGGTYSDVANWLGAVPNAVGDRAIFDGSNPTADAIVTLDIPVTLGGIDFSNPFTVRINGVETMTFDEVGVGSTIHLNHTSDGSLRINTDFAFVDDDLSVNVANALGDMRLNGSFGTTSMNLTKFGLGDLRLSGDNSNWSGILSVDLGQLTVNNSNALGTGSGTDADATTVNAGARLQLLDGIHVSGEKLRLNGGSLFGDATGTATWGGPIDLLSDSELGSLNEAGTLRIDGIISGASGITINQGFVRLDGPNTYTGLTTINGGDVRVNHEMGLGDASVGTILNAGHLQINNAGSEDITLNGGLFDLNTGTDAHNGNITFVGGTMGVGPSNGTLGGSLIVQNTDDAIINVLTGRTLNLQGGSSGTGTLRFDGPGTINIETTTLAHNGDTIVNDGDVFFFGDDLLAGPLTINGGDVRIAGSSSHGGTTINGGLLRINPGGSHVNAGGITVNALGELLFNDPIGNDANTNALAPNSVTLHDGRIVVGADVQIDNLLNGASTGGVVALRGINFFNNGGTFALNFDTMTGGDGVRLGATEASIIGGAVTMTPDSTTDTFRFGGSGSSLEVRAILADVAATPTHVHQGVDGVTILNAANTYTGTTIIDAGTLVVADAAGLGSSSTGTTINGGVLNILAHSGESIDVLGGTLNMSDTTNAHTGAVNVLSGDAFLNGLLGGPVVVNGGQAHLNGTAAGTITIQNGVINLNQLSTSTASLSVEGGEARFRDPTDPHMGDIFISGGSLISDTDNALVDGILQADVPGNSQVIVPTGRGFDFRGGTSGAGDLTLINDGNLRFRTTPLGHSGDWHFEGTGTTRLASAADHTGTIFIDSGSINLNGGGTGTIVQNPGTLIRLNTSTAFDGAIEINDATLTTESAGGIVNQQIAVNNGALFTTEQNLTLTLSGGVAGNGLIEFLPHGTGGKIIVGGTVNTTGELTVRQTDFQNINHVGDMVLDFGQINVAGPATVTGNLTTKSGVDAVFSNTVAVSGHLDLFGGEVAFNGNTSAANIRMNGGNLLGTGTLITANPIELRGGTIDYGGNMTSISEIRKIGHGTGAGELADTGIGFSGDINVQQGIARVTGTNGLGSGEVFVNSTNAIFSIDLATPVGGNGIFLNNASGYGYAGALISEDNNASYTGRVDLGNVGSYIGQRVLTLSGPITGGGLNFINGRLDITGNANTFTGPTEVSGTSVLGQEATLRLIGNGTLHTTSELTFMNGGSLALKYMDSGPIDRLGNNIPIIFYGGNFEFEAQRALGDVIEVLGPTTLKPGTVELVYERNAGHANSLTFSSLTREQGGSIIVVSDGTLGGGAVDDPKVFIGGQGNTAFLNGVIARRTEFAKYDATNGIQPLSTGEYEFGSENIWNANSNIRPNESSDTQLGASRMVNSVNFFNAPGSITNKTIDLADFDLNIASGAILGPGTINGGANGRLTAGGQSPSAELLFHSSDRGRLRTNIVTANITNNPGPDGVFGSDDDGVVSLTVAEGVELRLSGSSLYTGRTTVSGQLHIDNQAAAPAGDLLINGGGVSINGNFTANLGNLLIAGGGISGVGEVNAQEIILEAGSIRLPVNDIALRKTTKGIGIIDGNFNSNLDFNGSILVEEGLLIIGNERVIGANPLGARVLPGGILAAGPSSAIEVHGYIDLDGGTLAVSDRSTFTGEIPGLPTRIRVLSDSFVQTFQTAQTASFGAPARTEVVVASDMYLHDGASLTMVGHGLFEVSGDLFVGGEFGFIVEEPLDVAGSIDLQGRIVSNASNAILDLSTDNNISLANRFHVQEGQALTVTLNGQPLSFTLGSPSQFVSGNGTFGNPISLVDGGFVGPGESVGLLAVGEATFDGGGIYKFEVQEVGGAPGSGYDTVLVGGSLDIAADSGDPFIIELIGLDQNGDPGLVSDFDPNDAYRWNIVIANEITNFNPNAFMIDIDEFLAVHGPLPDDKFFSVSTVNGTLRLNYIPEPASLLVFVLSGLTLTKRRRIAA